MSARFAELMALSASQTRENNAATQQLLEEKKRKDEQRLRAQQAKEAREREMQAVLVRRRLEEAQRSEETQRRTEEARARKEAVLARREEEHRLNLMYGKDKRSISSSGGGDGSRGRKSKNGEDDDDGGETGTSVLTREEKRMRRLNNDLSRNFVSKRKDASYSSVNSPRRPGRSLAHEVIDSQKGARTPGSAGSSANDSSSRLSLRKQLSSMPQQLIKLNTVKRDTRTIDEIVNDLQRAKEAKIIAGDDARGFKDWFASREKEKEKEKNDATASMPTAAPISKKARSLSRSPSEGPSSLDTGRRAKSAVRSVDSGAASGRSTPIASKPFEKREPRTKVTMIKPERRGSIYFDKADTKVKGSGAPPPRTSSSLPAKQSAASRPRASSLADRSNTFSSKRKRSYSPEPLYDSDNLDDDDMYDDYGSRGRSSKAARPRNDISSEIWKLFGKDRDRYMQNNVYSDDDDDMEVDADALRREELRRFVYAFILNACFLWLITFHFEKREACKEGG